MSPAQLQHTLDQIAVVRAVGAVQRYFGQQLGPNAYIPRATWILHWVGQQKSPEEIFRIAMNTEHRSEA